MKNLLHTDKYTKKVYNTYNGKTERQWLMYGDNTYEPVRRDQSVKDKWTSPDSPFDWFVTQEPEDWDPVKAGHKVSLNHDYGQQNKPGGPPRAKPVTPSAKPATQDRKNFRLDRKGPDKSQFKPLPLQPGFGDRAKGRQTTLGRGADAYHEYEKQLMAAKAETAEGGGDAGKEANNPQKKSTNENLKGNLIDELGISWGGKDRSLLDGPKYGNWGGKKHSGGPKGKKIPIDSSDRMYMQHDKGWAECDKLPTSDQKLCRDKHNKKLVRQLENLSNAANEWPYPPPRGLRKDAEIFRKGAIKWFKK